MLLDASGTGMPVGNFHAADSASSVGFGSDTV